MKKYGTAMPNKDNCKTYRKMPPGYKHNQTNRKPHISTEMIIKALENSNGYITKAADDLGISVGGLSKRILHYNDGKELQAALHEIRERRLDLTENVFFKKIQEGDVQCILYHLKTHGKTRGYGSENNVNIDKNLNWKVEIVHSNADDKDKIEAINKVDAIDCTKQLPDTEENANYTDPT